MVCTGPKCCPHRQECCHTKYCREMCDKLPPEIWLKIFHCLSAEFTDSYISLTLVNKTFRDIARNPSLWRHLTLGYGTKYHPSLFKHIAGCSLLNELVVCCLNLSRGELNETLSHVPPTLETVSFNTIQLPIEALCGASGSKTFPVLKTLNIRDCDLDVSDHGVYA